MVASEIIDKISKFQVATYSGLEDFADRFNFQFTVILMLICTSIVTVKQYVLKPITCFLPTPVGGRNILDFVENYCWVQGTIPINHKMKLPSTEAEWRIFEEHKILYYQWIPFVLGLQCLGFYIPKLIWSIFCYSQNGTDLQHIVTSANQAVHSSQEAREKMVQHLANTLANMLFQDRSKKKSENEKEEKAKRSFHQLCSPPIQSNHVRETLLQMKAYLRSKSFKLISYILIWKHIGSRLVYSYFILKLIYLVNGILQIYMMQNYLGFSSNSNLLFGLEVARNIAQGRDWETTQIFPRVSYCYVRMSILGDRVAPQVAQCVLPVNMLNERIYVFLWFWIMITILITLGSIPIWVYRIKSRKHFIRKYLNLGEQLANTGDPEALKRQDSLDRAGAPSDMTKQNIRRSGWLGRTSSEQKLILSRFEAKFLHEDGYFMLKMIAMNAGDLLTADIISKLWKIYRRRHYRYDMRNQPQNEAADQNNLRIPLNPQLSVACDIMMGGGGGDSGAARDKVKFASMDNINRQETGGDADAPGIVKDESVQPTAPPSQPLQYIENGIQLKSLLHRSPPGKGGIGEYFVTPDTEKKYSTNFDGNAA